LSLLNAILNATAILRPMVLSTAVLRNPEI